MLKSKIRKKILNLRKKNSIKDTNLFYLKIFKEIKKKKIKNKIIGGYYPVNFEVDILELLYKLKTKGFELSLPIIKKNSEMDFYNWSSNKLLKLNKYGIPEPEKVKKVLPDIILVPIVAFDKHLYRIGYGGGYYDRYIKKISNIKKIVTIGLAFSFQKIYKLPINKTDERLDFILTEK